MITRQLSNRPRLYSTAGMPPGTLQQTQVKWYDCNPTRSGRSMAHYLVTGAAGFIGARTAEMLIKDGHTVIGIDNMNDAYDPRMKEYRLRKMQAMPGFNFHQQDISDKSIIDQFKNEKFDGVINLAARA